VRQWLSEKLSGTAAAVFLVGLAFLGAVLWGFSVKPEPLWPNVITTALGIAFGIVVLDRLARKREEQRLAPRVRRVLAGIGFAVAKTRPLSSWTVACDASSALAEGLVASFQSYRETDPEVIEPDLTAKLDAFCRMAETACAVYRATRHVGDQDDKAESERSALDLLLAPAKRFGEALSRYESGWRDMGNDVEQATSLHNLLVEKRREDGQRDTSA
jgi:hypothetical protein